MSIATGSHVLVQWSDGNKYPGMVVQAAPGQCLVDFGNGNQQWIGEQYLEAEAPAPAPAPSRQQQIGSLQVDGGALQINGGGGIRVYEGVQDEWDELQEVIARVEGQGMDLAGIDPADPISFWSKQFAIEEAQGQGLSEDQAAQQQGFHDEEHFDLISEYMQAKWSYVGTDEDGQQAVLQRDEFMNAALKARHSQMDGQRAAAAAADPNLLAPVAGVSVEKWAAVSAQVGSMGQGATQQQYDHLLAQNGLDRATWDATNAGWQAKMQGDTTGAIAVKFGEAFSAGAGAQAAGGGGAGGEPCTFEQYVEIMAAQACWSEQGYDVNAKLPEVFGIDAATYGHFSTYWGPKMGTDMALMQRYSELDAVYRQKYAGAGMDDDLSL